MKYIASPIQGTIPGHTLVVNGLNDKTAINICYYVSAVGHDGLRHVGLRLREMPWF